jgi:hypothetical protein
MATTTLKHVLVTGMRGSNDPKLSTATFEQMKQMIEDQKNKAREVGFEFTIYYIDPENPATISEFTEQLRARQWDGVNIGFGIRSNPTFTALFEELVNSAVTEVNPPPKLVFAVRPDLVVENCQRVFGL